MFPNGFTQQQKKNKNKTYEKPNNVDAHSASMLFSFNFVGVVAYAVVIIGIWEIRVQVKEPSKPFISSLPIQIENANSHGPRETRTHSRMPILHF